MNKNLQYNTKISATTLSPKSEKEFLVQKAKVYKSGLFKAVHQMATRFLKAVDVKEWTKKYPLQSTGIAAIAGFVVSDKFVSLASKGNTPSTSVQNSSESKTSQRSAKDDHSVSKTLLPMALTIGIDLLKEALMPVLIQHFQSKSEPTHQPSSSVENLQNKTKEKI